MKTLEKLLKYEDHLRSHREYLNRGVADPLNNHTIEKPAMFFGLVSEQEKAMAEMVHRKVMGK